MRYTSLKALQRPPRSAPAETTSYPTLLGVDGISSHTVRPDVERLAHVLGATTKANQYGEFLSVRCWCAQPPSFLSDPRALKLLLPEAPEQISDPGEWLFLDTETTGLSGGSGTYPFLVGLAWWEGGGLEIEQLLMREYSEERSLLFALRQRIADHPVVVTFNGKSFDWPLLETRYRMTRKISVPTPRAHLDFLHPARHLWRLRLGSVRLPELERHVLGWNRGADLLSGLIPQIYFDYLRGGPPERLVPVLNHNQVDLRGLAALSSRILSLLSDVENLGQDALELFGVSRICEKRGEDTRARSLYQKSIASFLPIETDRVARRSLARLAKRQGDFELACELWKDALGNSRHGYEAYEQLAIYYERKARDPEQAQEIVKQALDELRRAIQVGDIAPGPYREIKARFDHRLKRLERKSKRPLLDGLAKLAHA
jgi:uncharacterized protein